MAGKRSDLGMIARPSNDVKGDGLGVPCVVAIVIAVMIVAAVFLLYAFVENAVHQAAEVSSFVRVSRGWNIESIAWQCEVCVCVLR